MSDGSSSSSCCSRGLGLGCWRRFALRRSDGRSCPRRLARAASWLACLAACRCGRAGLVCGQKEARWRLRAVAGSGGGLEVAWDPLNHRQSGAFLA